MSEYLAYLFGVIFGAVVVIFIIALIAELVNRDSQNPWQTLERALGFFLGTDNRRWVVLLGVAVFATFMAITHPGDGLVKSLEEKAKNDPLRIELNEVRERHYNLREYGLYKTNAEMCVTSREFVKKNPHICKSVKEKIRTWIWWRVSLTFWALLLVYTIPAFWDDIIRAGRGIYARLRRQAGGEARFQPGSFIDRLFGGRRRREGRGGLFTTLTEGSETQQQTPAPGAAPQHDMNFWKVMMASLIPEVFINIIEWLSPRRRT